MVGDQWRSGFTDAANYPPAVDAVRIASLPFPPVV
jgi:hypothetical protein